MARPADGLRLVGQVYSAPGDRVTRAEIYALAARHGLRDVRVFGSLVRGDADDASDIDLLASLPPEKTGLALGALLMDMQDLLQRRVGVVTEKSLHAALRHQILMEAQPL